MEQQYSSFRWVVLSLLIIASFVTSFAFLCIPPLFMEITDQIPLTKTQMGLMMGVGLLSGIVFGPLGGGISDRIGCKWGTGIGLLIAGAGGVSRAFVESPWGLFVCMFFVGAGMNMYAPNMPKALGTWFPQERLGLANALCMGGLAVGGTVAMAISANFLSPAVGGWRGIMVVTGGLSLFIGIVWILLYRDPKLEEQIEEKAQSMLKNFKRVFKVKAVWLLSIFFGLTVLGLTPILTFLPINLQERGVERAGELVSILEAGFFVFGILGGIVSDKLGRRKPFILFGVMVAGLCTVTFPFLSVIPLIVALTICGAGLGVYSPVLLTMPAEMEEIGPELTATVVGFFFMLEAIGGFLGPIITGKIIDLTGSYSVAYFAMGATLIAAAAFVIPVKDTGSRSR